jgi:hypothetical protein
MPLHIMSTVLQHGLYVSKAASMCFRFPFLGKNGKQTTNTVTLWHNPPTQKETSPGTIMEVRACRS